MGQAVGVDGRYATWRTATERALYGPHGFFVRERPAAHFRTSVHASSLFARAVGVLLARVDRCLGHPERLDVVDVGAGGGELLLALAAAVPPDLAGRLVYTAVERGPRPAGLPGPIGWQPAVPPLEGLLFANEWLDNVPVDLAERGPDGVDRIVEVDPRTGAERLGAVVAGDDAAWLARWWPLTGSGQRAELGRPRDEAWSSSVRQVGRGLAVAVDYGHLRGRRPPHGSLTGYRAGRQVAPVPDGSCDLTSHVAMDATAAAGTEATGTPAALLPQRDVLRDLGITGTRPPRDLASTDPPAYLRALTEASQASDLTNPAGLGAFTWLLQPVALPDDWHSAKP